MGLARCSQCGHEMIFDGISQDDPRGPQAYFRCSNCEQSANVGRDGAGGMALVNLYPTPTSAKGYHEFADYQAGEKAMFAAMRVDAGWMSTAEFAEWSEELRVSVERYKAEHPLPRSLWRRLSDRGSGE